MGLYFIFVRPPLLPEDVRYMALPATQFDIVKPALETWLTNVFQVMGRYVLAPGVLTITLAATSFRAHHWAAAAGALIGGGTSIGWMAYVNFVINSDFRWVLLARRCFGRGVWFCSGLRRAQTLCSAVAAVGRENPGQGP